MSLTQAPKDIADKPKTGSVVDPVIKSEKDADVDRKLRFFGVITAFRQGKLPSNAQIDETLTYVAEHSPIPLDQLSPDGRQLIQDVRDIVESARLIVQEKNADELFQNFVWHTQDVDVSHAKKNPSEVVPVTKDKATQDGQEAVRHLRTILNLVLTNSEVRKLLSDAQIIGRDLLARGAATAANTIKPSEEKLANADTAAPHDQFHSADGQKVGLNETPVLQATVGDASITQHPKDDLGTGATIQKGDTVLSGEEAASKAQAKKEELTAEAEKTADKAATEAEGHAREVAAEDGQGPATEEKKQTLISKIKNLGNQVPQEHKDTANKQIQKGKDFLSEEFPEERRDQFIYRGKKAIIECQKHDDYQESISWLIGIVEEYANHTQTITDHAADSHAKVTGDGQVQLATRELRTLLERFANNQSIDPILDAINKLVEDAKTDDELSGWFKKLDAYIRKVLIQAGFVLEPQCDQQARELRDSGRFFIEDKYKGHFDTLFDSIGNWFKAMGEDPLNKRFGEDWARLTRDLLFDSEGSLKFKPHLWQDIQKVVLPTLVNQVGYLPIPRIEYTDDQLDLVVENLTLSGRNIFPNAISLEAHNFVKFSPYSAIKNESHHEFTFTFAQIQADMRDVAFYFKKKTGFPKLSDSGLADVLLGGSGLTTTVHLVSSDKDKSSVFKVKNVNVKVDTLKFSIRDSKHDVLYKALGPLATGLVKKQIQKALKDTITTAFEYIDGQLVQVRDRLDAAKESDQTTRAEALKELFQKKEAEANSSSSTKNSQFKVSTNKRQSILANAGHPEGWVNRTAEKEEQAVAGQNWKSPAFSIVPNATA